MMTVKHWTFGLRKEEYPAILIEAKAMPSLADIRAERIKNLRDRKSLLKIAANRKSFPLYRNGRMIVQHPNYEVPKWETDVPFEP